MSAASARNALITSAMFVAAIRLWMQVRGKTKTPFTEWAVGWGATFFILALLSEVAPTAAGSLSLVIVTSDFLVNAVGLTTDINSLVSNSETSTGASMGSIFVSNPFGNSTMSNTATTSASKSPRENSNPTAGLGHQGLQ